MNSVQYSILYSIYSMPNIVFPILGGILMDKFGACTVILTCSFLVLLSQIIFTLGVISKSFLVTVIGRALLGCGGENLDIGQSVIIVKWFTGKELSMAFAITSSISLVGSVLNDNISPGIVKFNKSLDLGLWLGVLVCLISFATVFFVIFIDKERDKVLGTHKNPSESVFKFEDFNSFNSMFWMLVVNNILLESCILCFSYIASGYIQDRFELDSVGAGSIMSIPYVIVAICTPVIGIVIDQYGKRGILLIFASGIVMGFQVALIVFPEPTLLLWYFVGLGIGEAIYAAAYWAAIAYVVDSEVIGTAYGVIYAAGNLGLVVFPIIVGCIQENTEKDHGYFWVNIFLSSFASLSLCLSLIIYYYDHQSGSVLHSSSPVLAKQTYIEKTL